MCCLGWIEPLPRLSVPCIPVCTPQRKAWRWIDVSVCSSDLGCDRRLPVSRMRIVPISQEEPVFNAGLRRTSYHTNLALHSISSHLCTPLSGSLGSLHQLLVAVIPQLSRFFNRLWIRKSSAVTMPQDKEVHLRGVNTHTLVPAAALRNMGTLQCP